MSEIQILKQFKEQIITFFDELISQFPEEADLVILRIFLENQIPIEEVINTFIHKLLTVREMITSRNESFFLENDSLFQKISKNKVNHFKRLWRSGRLDKDDKEVVWKWVDSFVFLADKYNALIRNSAENIAHIVEE